MPNNSNNIAFPTLQRSVQENNYFCGPAVLQMLLNYLGTEISQNNLVEAAGIGHKIKTHGTTIKEMGDVIALLFPQFQFWYKFNSSISDVSQIINTYQYPVGVEWQGLFDWPDEEDDDEITEEYDDDDPGHYSIITQIDTQQNIIMLADPEKHYAGKDRKFTVLSFEHRWWDINEIIDPQTGRHQEIDENHPIFIITPTDATFPDLLQMVKG